MAEGARERIDGRRLSSWLDFWIQGPPPCWIQRHTIHMQLIAGGLLLRGTYGLIRGFMKGKRVRHCPLAGRRYEMTNPDLQRGRTFRFIDSRESALLMLCPPRQPYSPPSLPPSPNAQDTVTGFLLAGCGHRTAENQNFLVVDDNTAPDKVENAFKEVSLGYYINILCWLGVCVGRWAWAGFPP